MSNINIDEDDLKFPNEPPRFTGADIERFAMWCVEQNTSDIVIKNEEQIICKIFGRIKKVTNKRLTRAEVIDMITYMYKSDSALTSLNGGEAVDFAWGIKVDRDTIQRFRVNITSVLTEGHRGYALTLRIIKDKIPDLETLKVPHQIIDKMCTKLGLVMVVGATGSGKSTLMASVIAWRVKQAKANLSVLTYESPIEFVFDGIEMPSSIVSQSEIGTHLDSFATGIANALRRAPEIIVMGEMRDKETISEGIIAAQTGHLVYGTIHVNGVPDAIRRMVNMFEPGEQNAKALDILSSLQLVIAQMLIPTIDGKRVAIREFLIFDEKIKEKIFEAGLENITNTTKKLLLEYGQTFEQDAAQKLKEGIISKEQYEIVRKTSGVAEKDLEQEAILKKDGKYIPI